MSSWLTQCLAIIGSLTGVTGAILGILNYLRAAKEPERLDMVATLTSLIERVRLRMEGVQKNLLGRNLDTTELYLQEEPLIQDLIALLKSIGDTDAVHKMHEWARLLTSDPYPVSRTTNQIRPDDPRIAERAKATKEFVEILECLRLKALRRKIKRVN